METVPVIDLTAPGLLDDLRHALGQVGFACLIGHGLDPTIVDAAFAASRAFHALPLDQKMAVELDRNHRGYLPMAASTDKGSELGAATRPNQSASFLVMQEGAADSSRYLDGPNQWPKLDGFRAAIDDYTEAAGLVAGTVLERICAAFELEDRLSAFANPTTWTRLLHYPAGPADAGFGSAPHTDFGAITLVCQDGTDGLQVRSRSGDWIDARPPRGALVLNAGEALRRWSGDEILATPHRVLRPVGRDRYSIAYFHDPSMDTPMERTPDPSATPMRFEDYVRGQLEAGYRHHQPAGDDR